MTTHRAIQKDVATVWQYVSLGAYAGILLFLTDGVSHMAPILGAGDPTWYYFVSAAFAALVCGIFFAIRGATSPEATYPQLGVTAGSLAATGLAICLPFPIPALPITAYILFGAFFGLGVGSLGIAHGTQLSILPERHFILKIILAMLAAGIIKIGLLMLPANWLGLGLILLVVGSMSIPPNPTPIRDEGKSVHAGMRGLIKGMAARNWVFLVSLILCLLVDSQPWTMVFSPNVNALADAFFGRLGTAVGAVTASVILWVLTRDRFLGRLRAAMPVIPLLCTALMLVTWYLLVWNDGLNLLGGADSSIGQFSAFASFEFSIFLGLFILLWRLRAEVRLGLPAICIYGILTAITAGLFLLFIVLQNTLLHAVMTGIDSVLRIVFLVVTAIYMMKPAPIPAPQPPDQNIQDLGERYGLSKREVDILALLLERRSAPYIAEVEYIALSTVKTHIKHIYEKTGAHNRAELLDILSCEQDGR